MTRRSLFERTSKIAFPEALETLFYWFFQTVIIGLSYLVRPSFSEDLFRANITEMTRYCVSRHQAVHGPRITLETTINESYYC